MNTYQTVQRESILCWKFLPTFIKGKHSRRTEFAALLWISSHRCLTPQGWQHSFVEIDNEIFSMHKILVNLFEDKACPVNVWLGKLNTLDMTPVGWLNLKLQHKQTRVVPLWGGKYNLVRVLSLGVHPYSLKGKATLTIIVSEMKDLIKSFILMQNLIKIGQKIRKITELRVWVLPFWIFNENLWYHKALIKYAKPK